MDSDSEKRALLQTGAGQLEHLSVISLLILLNVNCFAHACTVDTDIVQTGSIPGPSVNTTPTKLIPGASQTSLDVKNAIEEREFDSVLPCDPRQWMHRYFMLFFMCMLSFGSYYVYDNPTALQRTIMNVSLLGTV